MMIMVWINERREMEYELLLKIKKLKLKSDQWDLSWSYQPYFLPPLFVVTVNIHWPL